MARILGIGGSTKPGSTSEKALRVAARHAEGCGAAVELITSRELVLPIYDTESGHRSPNARRLLAAIARADGILIASPAYHGTLSGMIKNALDYIEDLRDADRTYLDGVAVGCIATASGWQAAASTLAGLRTTAHALRGWPTPLGVVVNSTVHGFGPDGDCLDEGVDTQLRILAEQVVDFVDKRQPAMHVVG